MALFVAILDWNYTTTITTTTIIKNIFLKKTALKKK